VPKRETRVLSTPASPRLQDRMRLRSNDTPRDNSDSLPRLLTTDCR